MHVFLFAVLSISSTVCSADRWDDRYSAAIEQIAGEKHPTADALTGDLRNLIAVWQKSADYAEVRARVAKFGKDIHGQVRVEIGTVSGTQYGVAWILSTDAGITMLSNFQGALHSTNLSPDTWESLQASIVRDRAWTFRSAADYAVNDGAVYAVSIWIQGGTGQFVIYAPTLGPPSGASERKDFAKRTAAQDRLLSQLIAVVTPVVH